MAELIDLSELTPHPNNPRDITPDELAHLKDSINGFEKMLRAKPIKVDENGLILAGNQRHKALIALGYKSIPKDWVQVIDYMTESEKKEFMVRDNIENGHWTFDSFDDEFWKDEPFEEWLGDRNIDLSNSENEEDTSLTGKESKSDQIKSRDPNVSDTDFQKLAGYHTAINRTELSAPLKFFKKQKLLKGSVLDYGCGMEIHDYEKFDPVYNPDYELLHKKYDTVICNYVINVVPLEHNRFELIRVLQSLVKEGGSLYVSVYGKDSIDTETDQSFQCGWTLNEWKVFFDKCCAYEVIKSSFWCFKLS